MSGLKERKTKRSWIRGFCFIVPFVSFFRESILSRYRVLPYPVDMMANATEYDGPRILLRPVSPTRPLWRRVFSTLSCSSTATEPLSLPIYTAEPTRVVVFLPFRLPANLDPGIEPYMLDPTTETPKKSEAEITASVSPIVNQLAAELYSSIFTSPEPYTEKPSQLKQVSPILTYHTETTDPTHVVLVLEHEMAEEEGDPRVLVAFADGEGDGEGQVVVSVWEGKRESWNKAWLTRR